MWQYNLRVHKHIFTMESANIVAKFSQVLINVKYQNSLPNSKVHNIVHLNWKEVLLSQNPYCVITDYCTKPILCNDSLLHKPVLRNNDVLLKLKKYALAWKDKRWDNFDLWRLAHRQNDDHHIVDMMMLTHCWDPVLWPEILYSGDKCRCYRSGTNKQGKTELLRECLKTEFCNCPKLYFVSRAFIPNRLDHGRLIKYHFKLANFKMYHREKFTQTSLTLIFLNS